MIATGVRSQSWSASSVIITRITTSVRFTKVITSAILIRLTTWGMRMSLRVIVTGGRMTLGAPLPPWRSSQPLVTARALTCPASTASAWPERLMADIMTLTWWTQYQENIRKNFKQQQLLSRGLNNTRIVMRIYKSCPDKIVPIFFSNAEC